MIDAGSLLWWVLAALVLAVALVGFAVLALIVSDRLGGARG